MKVLKLVAAAMAVLVCVNATELDYRWLETAPRWGDYYFDQDVYDWLEEQKQKLTDYHDKIDQNDLRFEFYSEYEEVTKLSSLKLNDGREIEISLAPRASEHVLKIEGKVFLNAQKLQELSEKYGEYNLMFRSMMLSPGGKHLTVPVYQKGSSTGMFLLFIELSDESKIVAFLDDEISPGTHIWLNQNTVLYSIWTGSDFTNIEFDVSSGNKRLMSSEEVMPKAINQGKFLYDTDSSDPEDLTSGSLVFRAKPYLAESFESVQVDLDTDAWPTVIGHTETYFILSTGRWNYENLLMVGYSYNSQGQFKLGEVKSFNPIKAGSIQRVLTNKGIMIAEYVAGPFRNYRVFDENGEMVKFLNAPKSGTLRSFEDLGSGNLKLIWTSQVVNKYEQRFNYRLDQWNPTAINRNLLVDKDGTEFVSYYKFIKSKDGTSVPVSVIHKKGLSVSSETPLYVTAYGGHGLVTNLSPRYRFGIHNFMNDGGVFAHPAVRGGGAYGHRWYKQVFGTLVRYEDTAASLTSLHDAKIGSPNTTVFEGWSNGGLLAGVMLSQYPELFKMVIPGNGLHDMVRKDVMKESGYWAWAEEFGGHNSKEEIEHLQSYSPLIYAMEDKVYPTVYVMAANSDRRVNPSHSYKLVAALQDHQKGEGEILLHHFENSGHWPVSVIHEGATGLEGTIKKWQAIYHELGMKTETVSSSVNAKQVH